LSNLGSILTAEIIAQVDTGQKFLILDPMAISQPVFWKAEPRIVNTAIAYPNKKLILLAQNNKCLKETCGKPCILNYNFIVNE
jgi:hypothetical protein